MITFVRPTLQGLNTVIPRIKGNINHLLKSLSILPYIEQYARV